LPIPVPPPEIRNVLIRSEVKVILPERILSILYQQDVN